MPDRLEGRLRWLFGVVAVVLVATGVCALLVASRAEPAQGGIDAAAFSSVAALLVASIVVVLALATLLVWSPRRFTHLMPILALASAAAALGFGATLVASPADDAGWQGALAGCAGALVLSGAAALGWLKLWLAPIPGRATAARDAILLDALLTTMAPAGEGCALGATDPMVRQNIVDAFAAASRSGRPLLRIVLRVLDAASVVKHRSGFAALAPSVRAALLAGLATSRHARLRAMRVTVDRIVLTCFYGDPRVRAEIGDDVGWVQAKIDAGPNAAAHRARREEAARVAAEAALAALAQQPAIEAEPEPVPVSAPDESATKATATETVPVERIAASGPSALQPSPERPPPVEEVPFDRAWTLGVPKEPVGAALGAPAMRVARSSGPTRP